MVQKPGWISFHLKSFLKITQISLWRDIWVILLPCSLFSLQKQLWWSMMTVSHNTNSFYVALVESCFHSLSLVSHFSVNNEATLRNCVIDWKTFGLSASMVICYTHIKEAAVKQEQLILLGLCDLMCWSCCFAVGRDAKILTVMQTVINLFLEWVTMKALKCICVLSCGQ